MAPKPSSDFRPPFWLKNSHAQNIFSSSGLRTRLLRKRFEKMVKSTEEHILELENDVRLLAKYSPQPRCEACPTLSILHGWEGSSQSGYVQSLAGLAYEQGYNIFRLNFRDHHDTHHLNKEIFNSSRIDEVVNALSLMQQEFPGTEHYLAGFSLGGNFAIRTAEKFSHPPLSAQQFKGVAAVCPVIDPKNSTDAVSDSLFIYEFYFTRKWKRSLGKKLEHFPEYDYQDELDTLKSMNELNQHFIPNYTEFKTLEAYFKTYTITPKLLENISTPTTIIAAEDDDMIPIGDVLDRKEQCKNSNVRFDIQRHGSHCAFLEDIDGSSWVDKRILSLFSKE